MPASSNTSRGDAQTCMKLATSRPTPAECPTQLHHPGRRTCDPAVLQRLVGCHPAGRVPHQAALRAARGWVHGARQLGARRAPNEWPCAAMHAWPNCLLAKELPGGIAAQSCWYAAGSRHTLRKSMKEASSQPPRARSMVRAAPRGRAELAQCGLAERMQGLS